MVPKIAARGSSFKGAGNYYLHDKDGQTAERVAWIQTENLRTDKADRAIRVMAATAMDREALKLAAGIRAGGRSSDKVVQTYSLSWHPEEQPSKAEMVQAARESLKALGLEEHQALIVCHTDEPHPHLHVIVNRVSPADGRLASTSQEKLKLSRWAEDWEKRHGKVWCEERVRNNAERDRHRAVQAEKEPTRSVFEAMREVTAGFDRNQQATEAAADLKADHQRKAAELASLGRDMHEHYRQELSNLGADYQRDKQRIKAEQRMALVALKEENQEAIRTTMQTFTRQQDQERRTTLWRERSLLGRVWNAYDAGRQAEGLERLGKTLWSTVSRAARLDSLHAERAARRQGVYEQAVGWARGREAALRSAGKAALDANYQKFLAARKSTLRQYETEQKDYRRQWAERTAMRREAWQEYRKTWEPRERTRQLHERQKENYRRLQEELARRPRPDRDRSRNRGRDYDFER